MTKTDHKSEERLTELDNLLKTVKQPINKDGFYGKLNKYPYEDLEKLRDHPVSQRVFGEPSAPNNGNIKDLVGNCYQTEYLQQ